MKEGISKVKSTFCIIALLMVILPALPSFAQRYNPSLEWQEISTQDVRVIFPRHLTDTARRAVSIIEEVIPELKVLTGATLHYRPAIVLHDQTDSSQGYADPLQGEIHISISQPSDLTFGSRPGSWLRLVLAHELAHLFHLGAVGEGFTLLQSILGYVVLPNVVQPMWVWEGYAMYAQGLAGAGGGADNPVYRMYLRDHALRDDFVQPHLLRGYSFLERFPGRTGVYVYGASMIDYIAERFGEESLAEISSLRAELLSLRGFERAVKRVLGLSMETLWEDWQEYMKAKALQDKERVKKEGLTPFTVIGGKGFSSRGVVLDPAHSRIIYTLHHPHYPAGIWTLDLEGGEERLLVRGSIAGRPVYSTDGERLVYSRRVRGIFSDWNDIFEYHLKQKKETRLTEGLRAWSPVYYEDSVLFLRRNVENEGIYTLGQQEPLFVFEDTFRPLELVLCPQGKKFAVSGWRDGMFQTALLDATSGDMSFLPTGRWAAFSPSFTDDGSSLLFISDRFDMFNVYAYCLKEETIYQLTNVTAGVFEAAFSGDDLYAVVFVPDGYALGHFHLTRDLWRSADFGSDTRDSLLFDLSPVPDAPVSSYRPFSYLGPRYWIPLPYGFSIEGRDPLAFHTYRIALETPPESGWRGDIWYRGLFAFPEFEARLRFEEERYEGAVHIRIPWKTARNGERYLGVGWEQSFIEHEMKSDYWRGLRLGLGASYSSANEHWFRGSGWDVSLRYGHWGEEPAKVGVASWWTFARRTGRHGVRWGFSGAVGAADVAGWFTGGGRSGSWPVAGYAPGEIYGRYAAKARLEARIPLIRIDSPLGNMGIIRGIDGTVFADGVLMGEELHDLHPLFSVGAQISLSAYIAEEIPFSVTLGVAQPLEHGREPEWYVEAGVSFTF